MKIFSITGWSKSGKTTLITKIIERLKLKNKKIFAVKNVVNKYHLEPESKDTYKFLNAGSDEVFLVAKNEILNMKKIKNKREFFGIIESKIDKPDFVLLEGLYTENIPVIEVFNSRQKRTTKFPIEKLSAIVSDQKITEDIPYFNLNDIDGIVKFMEDYNG